MHRFARGWTRVGAARPSWARSSGAWARASPSFAARRPRRPKRLSAVGIERARLEAEREECSGVCPRRRSRRRSRTTRRRSCAAQVERLERRREALGQVNPLAAEEHAREKAAPRGADRAARGPRALARGARAAPRRAHRDGRAALRGDARRRRAPLRGGGRRRSSPAGEGRLVRVEEDEEEPGIEIELQPAGQADHAPVAPLRRREGARRDLVPLRALPGAAVPLLPPRRGRGRARRREHRTLRRAPAALRGPGAVHRRHAPETDDGGRGYPLRRHDGRRRRLPDRLEAARRGARAQAASA